MTELWTGTFGDDYTMRNSRIDISKRSKVWDEIIPDEVGSILEVGANVGANLQALELVGSCELYACEPNALARSLLKKNMEFMRADHITADTADRLSFADNSVDLVFTCGVLIHIPEDKLAASMREIYRVARRYIICGEYENWQPEMVHYRGHDDALWRRPYGEMWSKEFPSLSLICKKFAGNDQGFDNLSFWVFKKA